MLRGGQKKPFHIDQLTDEQWKIIENCEDLTCGLTSPTLNKLIEIPNFIYLNNCKKHDLMTSRGGGLLDFYETNYYFWKYNFIDTFNFFAWLIDKVENKPIINRMLYTLLIAFAFIFVGLPLAFIFSLFATIGDAFVFNWGKYKTLEEILEERCYN